MSLALFGDESHHRYVRLCTAIEVIEHPAYYDTRKEEFVVRDQRVNTSDYATVLAHALQDGKESELVHLYAVSAALNVVIQSYVPPASSVGLLDSPYTCVILGRGVAARVPQVSVMWSSTRPLKSKCDVLNINHVVMLALRPELTTTGVVALDDDDDQPLQEDDRTCDYDEINADNGE